jgi:protoporphyrinogen oxidase
MLLGKIDKTSKVHIIGAGISGLLAGFFLKKQGCDIAIWDTASKPGGKIASITTEWGLVETAANAIILDPHVQNLLTDLKLTPLKAKPNLKRWIYDGTQLISSSRIAVRAIFNLCIKGYKKIPHKDKFTTTLLSDFFTPFMGQEWSHQTLSAICRGIYARNANELTMDALFSPHFLHNLPEEPISYWSFFYRFIKYKKQNLTYGSISFKGGMQELIDALTSSLNTEIHLNTTREKIQELIQSGNVLICTTPPQVEKMLQPIDPTLSKLFSQIPMTDVQSTTIFTKKKISFLDRSFGVLYTPQTPLSFYGILAQSEIFSDRVKTSETFCYTLIGPIVAKEKLLKDLKKFTQLKTSEILHYQSFEWPNAIPVYREERKTIVSEITSKLREQKNLMGFFGNYTTAIGLKDLVKEVFQI